MAGEDGHDKSRSGPLRLELARQARIAGASSGRDRRGQESQVGFGPTSIAPERRGNAGTVGVFRLGREWHGAVMNGTSSRKENMKQTQSVQITPPNIQTAVFTIEGTAPLVIHRFSAKSKAIMLGKMEEGSTAKKGKKREPLDVQATFNASRYISKEGWDGFNVAAIRCAIISACRLVGFKMTLAKLSVFVVADGVDKTEPQFGLIRILNAKAVMQQDIARVETGQAYVCIRAAYHGWKAKVRIRFDADQFTVQDISNLLARVGNQVGLGEGRADSKNSCGMGWGSFSIVNGK